MSPMKEEKNMKYRYNKWIITNQYDQHDILNMKSFSSLILEKSIFMKNLKQVVLFEDQDLLRFDMSRNSNSSRRNIAYLLAIQYGAEFIYESERVPAFNLSAYFDFELEGYGLIYDCHVVDRKSKIVFR